MWDWMQHSIRFQYELVANQALCKAYDNYFWKLTMCAEPQKTCLACARASRSLLSGSSSVAAKDCRNEMAADSSSITAPTTSRMSVGILKH